LRGQVMYFGILSDKWR